MPHYKTKVFARFARRAGLDDVRLKSAAHDAEAGLWDADLGGGVFKIRVARDGGGKSGGFRTLLALRLGAHAFFIHGFAKSEKANVTGRELQALRLLAASLLALGPAEIALAIEAGELLELETR